MATIAPGHRRQARPGAPPAGTRRVCLSRRRARRPEHAGQHRRANSPYAASVRLPQEITDPALSAGVRFLFGHDQQPGVRRDLSNQRLDGIALLVRELGLVSEAEPTLAVARQRGQLAAKRAGSRRVEEWMDASQGLGPALHAEAEEDVLEVLAHRRTGEPRLRAICPLLAPLAT
jgi:hypothetical protein